jgi:hypothetical protein
VTTIPHIRAGKRRETRRIRPPAFPRGTAAGARLDGRRALTLALAQVVLILYGQARSITFTVRPAGVGEAAPGVIE